MPRMASAISGRSDGPKPAVLPGRWPARTIAFAGLLLSHRKPRAEPPDVIDLHNGTEPSPGRPTNRSASARFEIDRSQKPTSSVTHAPNANPNTDARPTFCQI